MKKLVLLFTIPFAVSLVGCSTLNEEKDYFKSWNTCESLTLLKKYVKSVTNPKSKFFIPEQDRIATFDMDGTFIGELYPTYFEYNLLEYRALEDPNYKDIAPADVKETAQQIRDFVRDGVKLPDHFDMKHAYAAAKAYAGMTLKEFDEYVKAYAQNPANGFENMTYADSFYKPMLEIFDYLKDKGFTYYVVSGSDRLLCRSLVESIGIEPNRVIGMDVVLKSTEQGYQDGVDYTMSSKENIIRTDELIIKNLKTNKVKQIMQEIGKTPVLSFGNSSGDSAMHNFCLGNKKYNSHVFMVLADNYDDDHADVVETEKRKAAWEKAGYNIFSMKNDFKTIYGEDVKKVDFTWSATDVHEVQYDEFIEAAKAVSANNYSKASLSVVYELKDDLGDTSIEPVIENHNYKLTASYNAEDSSWSIDGDDPAMTVYGYYLDYTADKTSSQDDMFTPDIYQSNIANYYLGSNMFRYRFNASGVTEIPALNISLTNSRKGARVFDQYGFNTYSELFDVAVDNNSNRTISITEIVFISYE